MDNHYHIIEEIGAGSYGHVYKVRDGKGNLWAMKRIKIDEKGMPCLLEASIMASIRHPGLNNSVAIFSTDSHLNIVQDLAVCDISKHTKGKITNLYLARNWMFLISSAVYTLHRLGIVQGDIKGGNILYFSDNDVRLTDFTLSTNMYHKEDSFNVYAGTYSHCGPELLIGKLWNRSIDIWALGCLFYEIVFGKLLFNYQKLEDNKIMRIKYHNAIASWSRKNELIHKTMSDFIRYDYEPMLNNPEYSLFKDLLYSMLKYNPEERLNIRQVMEHPFFQGFQPIKVNIIDVPTTSSIDFNNTTKNIHRNLMPNFEKIGFSDIEHINKLSLDIYLRLYRIYEQKPHLDDLILSTCCWIAAKLVIGIPPILNTNISIHRTKIMEHQICNHLSYCFPITNLMDL